MYLYNNLQIRNFVLGIITTGCHLDLNNYNINFYNLILYTFLPAFIIKLIYIYILYPFLLSIPTLQSVTTLGFTINSLIDYSDHISIMIRNANYILYNIRKSRNKLFFSMTKSLIHSLVFSRLIYCCSLLCNLPLKLMLKL